jgi:integrase
MSYAQELVLQGQPYMNFINSLKSPETKIQYRKTLLKFIQHYNITSLDGLLSFTRKDVEEMITKYVTNMNARGLSYGYINLVMCSIFHFFEMNDVVLNKRKISKFMGEHKKMNKDRAYTHEEIKLMVDSGDFRFRAIVLFLASTGCRISSVCDLEMRHLKKIRDDIYKVTIYENTKEEYFVLTTPECTSAIDQYVYQYREKNGETIKPTSPLFRNDFDMNSMERIRKNSKRMASQTLKTILYARLRKVGLIEKSDKEIRDHQFRHSVPLSHGFRKFWMNQAVNAKLNPEIREMLLGHKIGLSSAYYRPSEEEMLEEFMKAVDNLTINEENRLRRKVEVLTIEKSKVDLALSGIEDVKKRMGWT